MSPLVQPVILPIKRLDLEGALQVSQELRNVPPTADLTIDFGPLRWIEPFGMLYFARQLRAFADQHKQAKCRAVNHEGHGYAAHMGFFQSFGLDFGKNAGAAAGSSAYVPITELNIRRLHIAAANDQVEVQTIIERLCVPLATVLARSSGGSLHQTLVFCLREIFRNVTEHSNADSIWYAAQFWPEKAMVELSILDQGLGVRKTLSRNPHLSISSDLDALRWAVQPGISGRAFEGGPPLRQDVWANSGYGLFMTSQICSRGGSFAFCSGEHGVLLSAGTEKVLSVGFAGTAIRLSISVPEVRALDEELEELSRRGAALGSQAGAAANKSASMSSRMLTEDFQKT
jgi:hypothetical protein